MAAKIYEIFEDKIFDDPVEVLKNLNKLDAIKDDYKISPAVGRVMPRFGWVVLRVGGFLAYELMLSENLLSKELAKCSDPAIAVDWLQANPTIESILRDKACRMYVSWIGHPDLKINISKGMWKKADFLMPVDGHVGKIFSRAGMIKKMIHEGKENSSQRWNIIIAAQIRDSIQEVVRLHGKDAILVDHGAFQLGLNCCPDNLDGICCIRCSKIGCKVREHLSKDQNCVLAGICKKNTIWRAF